MNILSIYQRSTVHVQKQPKSKVKSDMDNSSRRSNDADTVDNAVEDADATAQMSMKKLPPLVLEDQVSLGSGERRTEAATGDGRRATELTFKLCCRDCGTKER